MTDIGRLSGNEACQEAGFNYDKDILYSKVYKGFKWGLVSQVEESVLSISDIITGLTDFIYSAVIIHLKACCSMNDI